MFTLGIPHKQYRRATHVLGHKMANPVDHEVEKQDDGFYIFKFPGVDEFDFKDIVILLKSNGITTIGADDQLSEKKIMKLSNLINEHYKDALTEMEGPEPEAGDIIKELEGLLRQWPDKAHPYYTDVLKLVQRYEDQKEDFYMNLPDTSLYESKIRKFIRNEIKKFN